MAERDQTWRRFVNGALTLVGSFWSFLVALAFLILWTAVGPVFGFSDTWQLVLNTVASVVAFLLVFLIQYSQNRDTRAIPTQARRATHEPVRTQQQAGQAGRAVRRPTRSDRRRVPPAPEVEQPHSPRCDRRALGPIPDRYSAWRPNVHEPDTPPRPEGA
jgi:Low affinity iron permease